MANILNLNAFLWLLRVFGELPVAEERPKEIFCKIMVVLHMALGITFTAAPLIFAKSINEDISIYWIYLTLVWHFCKRLDWFFFQHFDVISSFLVFGIFFTISGSEILINANDVKQLLFQLGQTHPAYEKSFDQKKCMLFRKHSIFMLGLLIEQLAVSATVISIWTRQYVIMVYYQIIIELKVFEFIIAYDIIRVQLEILKDDLVDLNSRKYFIKPKMLTMKLINIREFYEGLHDTVTLVNDTGAYTLLTIFILFASSFASMTYWLVLGLLKNIQVLTLFRKYRVNFFFMVQLSHFFY